MRKLAAAAGVAAVLGAVAVIGVTSVGAVEPAIHFWRCLAAAGGTDVYSEPSCFRAPPPADWERTYIASTAITIKTAGTSAFELETTVAGQTLLITCTAETGTGKGSNPEPFKSTNGEGEATLTFEGCTVSKFASCVIPGKKIVTSKLHEAVEESKTFGPGIKFTPASGTTFATVALGAECALGEEIVLKGSDFGIANKESELEFTNASSALTAGTKEAKLRGKLKQEDEKGQRMSVS